MPFEKQTVWVCPGCKDEDAYYLPDGPSECPLEDCRRTTVKRRRWVCTGCGQSYPGNRKPPEHCEECGELFRRV